MDGTEPVDLDRLLESIESQRFAMNANVASSFRVFNEVISNSPEYRAMLELFEASSEDMAVIIRRIRELAGADVQAGYINRSDVSIATYVLAILRSDLTLARVAAFNAGRAPNVWWVREAMERLEAFGPTDYSTGSYISRPNLAALSTSQDVTVTREPWVNIELGFAKGHLSSDRDSVADVGDALATSISALAEQGTSGSSPKHESRMR